MTPCTWLNIGRISGVHGLAGNLKIWSYTDACDTFAQGREIILSDKRQTRTATYTIDRCSNRKKGVLVSLEGVSTRNDAEMLVGKEIFIDRTQLPDLEADTWYWEDLTGLEVTDHKLGNLGTVQRLFSTHADDILVVKGPAYKEVLIPMNAHFVDQVDIQAGTLTTTLPAGFILE